MRPALARQLSLLLALVVALAVHPSADARPGVRPTPLLAQAPAAPEVEADEEAEEEAEALEDDEELADEELAEEEDAAEEVPEAERIKEIRVEGNRRVEGEAIRRAMVQRVGLGFDPDKTSEDLRALWALRYFSDVQLLVQRQPDGIVYLVRVEERPSIREVRLSGNQELSAEDFKETLDLRPFSILDHEAIRQNARKIREQYIEKGYFLAEVESRLEPVEGAHQVDVVFEIREHAKVLVKQISFIGVSAIPEAELKAVMATREGSLLSFLTGEGIYREELFERDLAVIQAAYYDRGYINVQVDKPSLSLSPDKRHIFITIPVEEGDAFTVSELGFSGDLLVSKEQLGALMTSTEGELFNRAKLAGDIQRITDLYYDRGYAYANVTPVTRVNAEDRTIELIFDVQQGKQVTIERIEVIGNTKTRDKVIRRELRVHEGELFSGSGIRRSQERVNALGFFEKVEVTQRQGSDDEHVVVQVQVEEKATGTFQLGFGFSNVENFIFTAQISQNNFLGWGQTVSASAQLSGLRNLIQLSFFDPYFLDTRFIFAADFFRNEAEYPDFLRQSTGGTLNLGYHLFEDVMVNVAYNNEYVRVEPGSGLASQLALAHLYRSGTTSSVRLSATWDRRDNRLFPSKGFIHHGSVESAPSFLGGSFLFNRYSAYSRLYFPLPWLGLVFKTNSTIGYIQPLTGDVPLPISELYFLGGINTLRGYYLRSISPTAIVGQTGRPDSPVTNILLGGNKQLIFNFELEFPLFEQVGIRAVLFYDAGNAYAPNEMFFQDRQERLPLGMFHSVGFGFRWFSPIGPLRFEWGIPLTPRATDQPIQFEFTIGNFF